MRGGQGLRGGNRPDAARGRGVARLGGAQQVAGLAAQVVQAGTGRKIDHDVSFTACDPRGGPTREIAVSCYLRTEVDYVLPADPEAPSRACRHGISRPKVTRAANSPRDRSGAMRSRAIELGVGMVMSCRDLPGAAPSITWS